MVTEATKLLIDVIFACKIYTVNHVGVCTAQQGPHYNRFGSTDTDLARQPARSAWTSMQIYAWNRRNTTILSFHSCNSSVR